MNYDKYTDEELAREISLLRWRCQNGETANVYPLLEAANAEYLRRGKVPAQVRRRR